MATASYNQRFIQAFKEYSDSYILIGGTATSIILANVGLRSRSTPDYDVVLTEVRNQAFLQCFVQFIQEGDYQPESLDEKGKLFRFQTKNKEYPQIIELFCNEPVLPLQKIGRTAPVSFEHGMSLSALLLDEEYYQLIQKGQILVDGYSVMNNKYLIVFKAKAWLDLRNRKKSGQQVDSKNIKKHLNDIARLVGSLEDTDEMPLSNSVRKDMQEFLSQLEKNLADLPDHHQNRDIILERKEILDILEKLLA